MKPRETKAQECAKDIAEEVGKYSVHKSSKRLSGDVLNSILHHFPEPQSEYTWPELCAKCNQHHVGVCETVEMVCKLTPHDSSGWCITTSCDGKPHTNMTVANFCPYCGGKIKV